MNVKCDKCPECKKEMSLLYKAFTSISWLGIYPEIRGQVCDNKKCNQSGVERRHDRNGEQMTKEEYKG